MVGNLLLKVIQQSGFILNFFLHRFGLSRFGIIDRLFVELYFAYKKVFEKKTLRFLDSLDLSGTTVIDIGAGLGFYTEYLSNLVGSSGKVIAFEPETLNYARLTKLESKTMKNITFLNSAVSSHCGTGFLTLNLQNPADHTVTPLSEVFDGSSLLHQPITMLSIDCLQKRIEGRISLCKIDVQGHEIDVLKGSESLLNDHGTIFMIEFDHSYGEDRLKILWNHLMIRNYRAHTLDNRGKLIEIQRLPKVKTYIDLVFIPIWATA